MAGYVVQVFSLGYVAADGEGGITYVTDRKHVGVFGHAQEAFDIMIRAGWATDAFMIIPFDEFNGAYKAHLFKHE